MSRREVLQQRRRPPRVFITPSDGVVWNFLGEGSYNYAYVSADRRYVYKVSKQRSATDDSDRAVRLWNKINNPNNDPALEATRYEAGWKAPFISGIVPTSREISDAIIDIYSKTQRIIMDAYVFHNFVKIASGQVVCIDIGLALLLGKDTEDSLNVSMTSLDFWQRQKAMLHSQFQELPTRCQSNTIKALIYMQLYYPEIKDVSVLKINPRLLGDLADAYDHNRDPRTLDLDRYFPVRVDHIVAYNPLLDEFRQMTNDKGEPIFSDKHMRALNHHLNFSDEHRETLLFLIKEKQLIPDVAVAQMRSLNEHAVGFLRKFYEHGLRRNHLDHLIEFFSDETLSKSLSVLFQEIVIDRKESIENFIELMNKDPQKTATFLNGYARVLPAEKEVILLLINRFGILPAKALQILEEFQDNGESLVTQLQDTTKNPEPALLMKLVRNTSDNHVLLSFIGKECPDDVVKTIIRKKTVSIDVLIEIAARTTSIVILNDILQLKKIDNTLLQKVLENKIILDFLKDVSPLKTPYPDLYYMACPEKDFSLTAWIALVLNEKTAITLLKELFKQAVTKDALISVMEQVSDSRAVNIAMAILQHPQCDDDVIKTVLAKLRNGYFILEGLVDRDPVVSKEVLTAIAEKLGPSCERLLNKIFTHPNFNRGTLLALVHSENISDLSALSSSVCDAPVLSEIAKKTKSAESILRIVFHANCTPSVINCFGENSFLQEKAKFLPSIKIIYAVNQAIKLFQLAKGGLGFHAENNRNPMDNQMQKEFLEIIDVLKRREIFISNAASQFREKCQQMTGEETAGRFRDCLKQVGLLDADNHLSSELFGDYEDFKNTSRPK